MDVNQSVKTYGGAITGVASPFLDALAGWMPVVAAFVSIVWLSINIIEKVSGKTFATIIRCLIARLRK